ncbi:MAG: glutamine--tRNA ligase/YqeY domain fusion protein [Oligoflexales bacterium]
METEDTKGHHHFIKSLIEDDIKSQKWGRQVTTRFPPEPNGYLHIGHAKSICLNFEMANKYQGVCHMRFDDTNPTKESVEFAEAILNDVKWLGYDWGDLLHYSSDYFQELYESAVELIRRGKAFVCELSFEQMKEHRGTLTEVGQPSPYRDRSIEENLRLFEEMKQGNIPEGKAVLRAKIDMSSGNINMRDPVMYRILHAHHHRTGSQWCIYPMYDYTHCMSDSIERITNSLCTLEFQDHRPLYDWFLEALERPIHPRQTEFARLNMTYTVLSKRHLRRLVEEKHVDGWDDPRMPTLVGLRRRGYTPASIRRFCERIGVSKKETTIDTTILEDCLRDDLNETAARAMAVLHPLKVTLTNIPEGDIRWVEAPNHPQNPEMGTRLIPLTRDVYIEQDDFLEEPPKKFFRLGPGKEVRLRYGYVIRCDEVVKDAEGNVLELLCSCDEDTLGKAPEGRKVKGIIHWVSATEGKSFEVRLYDRLFENENPSKGEITESLNDSSLEIIEKAYGEPSLQNVAPGTKFQFERLGYFSRDEKEDRYNRCVTLRDTWAKVQDKK